MVNSKLRRHKVMEKVIKKLMGGNLPPKFKFRDTYASIEVPTAYQQYLPTQQQLETEFDEMIAEEDAMPTVDAATEDVKVISSNLYIQSNTGNVGIGTASPGYMLDVTGTANVGALSATSLNVSGPTNTVNLGLTHSLANRTTDTVFYSSDGNYIYKNTAAGLRTALDVPSASAAVFTGNVGIGTVSPSAKLHVNGSAFASKYLGGLSTFLTGDYTSTAATSFTSVGQTIAMIQHTFNVPQEYHLLGTANLESQVMIKWCGEMDDPWNFMFYIDLYHSGLSTPVKSTFNTDSTGTRSNGAGVPVVNHHEDYNSTMESAMIGSRIYIPNCDVSSGSTITIKLVGRRGSYNTSGTVYTNRTKNTTNNLNYERGITNFFMALKVV